MAMYLFTEKLLEKEIRKLDAAGDSEDANILKSQYQRELEAIRRLKIDFLDIAGPLDDVKKRFEKKNVYLINPDEFAAMKEKAAKYDRIKKITEE